MTKHEVMARYALRRLIGSLIVFTILCFVFAWAYYFFVYREIWWI